MIAVAERTGNNMIPEPNYILFRILILTFVHFPKNNFLQEVKKFFYTNKN